MTKREIVMQIRAARASHVRWKSYVQIALRGIVTNQTQASLPIVQTECDFGKWYYGDGMYLNMLSNFQALEIPHEMIHEMYIQIYTLQKAKLQGGFFTNKRKLLKRRQVEISKLIANLNDYSRIILETLQQLEIDVLQMSINEISGMYTMDSDDTEDENAIPPLEERGFDFIDDTSTVPIKDKKETPKTKDKEETPSTHTDENALPPLEERGYDFIGD